MSEQTRSCTAQSTKKVLCLCIGTLLLLATVMLVGCNSDRADSGDNNQKTNAIAQGATAPDFDFTLADGTKKSLSDYRGQVVLLNFWATWCGYCIDEMPDMQKIAENYSNVEVLAINRGDSSSQATSFIEASTYSFSWALDENEKISSLYPANGVPYTVIIDKDGVITKIFEGSSPDIYSRFEEAVLAAGAEKS